MLENLLNSGSYIAGAIFATAVISVAFFRYAVPALLAAFAISKGRRASIRTTKQGIEIETDVATPDVAGSQGVWIASVGSLERPVAALPEQQSEPDITDSVEKMLVTAFEAGR